MAASKLLKSSSLMGLQGLIERVAGLLSTLILARILMPEDFGIVVMSFLIILFFQEVTDMGENSYLESREKIDNADINGAFTLNLMIKVPIYVTVCFLSPFIAKLFESPEIVSVIILLCLFDILNCFKNPALVLMTREYKYERIFYLGLTTKFTSILVTVSFAVLLKNHWALVIGHATTSVISVVGSYVIFKYLPRLDRSRIRKQLNFSIWILCQKLVGYFRNQLDTFLTGIIVGKAALGAYNNMKFISQLPSFSILYPMTEPLVHTFREFKHAKEALKIRVDTAVFITLACMTPIATVFYLYSYEIVFVILGKNWTEYQEIFAISSLILFIRCPQSIVMNLVYVYDDVKYLFYIDLISLIVAVICYLSIEDLTYVDIAIVSVFSHTIVLLVFIFHLYIKHLGSPTRFVIVSSIPLLFFFIVSPFIKDLIIVNNSFFHLVVNGLLLCMVYAIFMMLVMVLCKRTELGNYILTILVKNFKSVAAKLN